MMHQLKYLVILVVSIFGLQNQVFAEIEEEPLKFLFIGNSYTYMNDMPAIFEKMAKKSGKNVLVEKNTKGGASFRSHTGRADMFEAIRKRQWDYVVLQGFSREMSFQPEHIDTASVPYIQQILDSIYENNPCTNVRFYMTWGYDGGFDERKEIDTYEKMADSIRKGYEWIGKKFSLPVVPVGMAWRETRNQTGIDLYYTDRAHPSINGSYLIAATFYSAFFNEPLHENYIARVKKRNARKINKLTYRYVSANRSKYHLDDYLFDIDVEETRKDGFKISYEASFQDASLKWYLNDSLVSSDTTGILMLESVDDSVLTLEIARDCGNQSYKRLLSKHISKARRRRFFNWF